MKQFFDRASRKLHSLFKKGSGLVLVSGLALSILLPIVPKNIAFAASTALTPTPRVSFTFDDGLDSAATYADPILKAAGFTGTDYVISGCVGMTTVPNTCHANPDTTYMTAAQISQLKADGWEIGDHTVDHPCLASNAIADPSDCPAVSLTPAQVNAELINSQSAIAGITGTNPTDFATPYGDWTPPVLAEIAKVVASHRGFADSIDQTGPAGVPDGVIDHGNTFPYNDYLLYDYQVQGDGTIAGGVTVAQVESMIDQTKANNQWLVLTFHNILPTASADPANYEYSTANFQTIVNYVKAQGLSVVNVGNGLVTNTGNLLSNASFNTALSSNTADQTVWSTDSPTAIKQDAGGNGNYPDPTNSVLLGSTAADTSLFSPVVPADPTKTYVLKNYLNIQAMNVAAGHEIAFYVDEYDASGAALPTRLMRTEVGNAGSPVGAWVESLNYEYKPSGTNVAKARERVVVTANSATTAYLDNVQWFAEDGSTTGNATTTTKPGDVNGDGAVNALDLSIIASNWQKSGVTSAQGDLNGDGAVNALDLSILATNWGK